MDNPHVRNSLGDVADVIAEHRWLTTLWRCSCEDRSIEHPVSQDAFDWYAIHLANVLFEKGFLKNS